MSFTLCYTYRSKRVVTKIAVTSLTPYAALCYALLQSGASDNPHQASWPDSYEALLEVAQQLGLTDLSFHRSLQP